MGSEESDGLRKWGPSTETKLPPTGQCEDSVAIYGLTLPKTGDAAYYRSAATQSRRLLVTVTEVFKNGRIRVEFPDGSWRSLPRQYHKRIQNERYGLVRIRVERSLVQPRRSPAPGRRLTPPGALRKRGWLRGKPRS
jgi:hypothetical protein